MDPIFASEYNNLLASIDGLSLDGGSDALDECRQRLRQIYLEHLRLVVHDTAAAPRDLAGPSETAPHTPVDASKLRRPSLKSNGDARRSSLCSLDRGSLERAVSFSSHIQVVCIPGNDAEETAAAASPAPPGKMEKDESRLQLEVVRRRRRASAGMLF
ncbi:hypothetical protein T484DRAFT_1741061 [Baffinella frigidus]|nr:hypothetical protein T484DRAFT_1741061 [Cryptophyta sp. CCMP2293]